MEKTPKYDLSQWNRSDRILMEDFNRDNANLEAALAALAAGQSAETARVNTELAKKADITTLNSVKSALQKEDARLNSVKLQLVELGTYTFTPTAGSKSAECAVSGLQLGQCVACFIDVEASVDFGTFFTINGSGVVIFQGNSYSGGIGYLCSGLTRYALFPLGNPDVPAGTVAVCGLPSSGYTTTTYRQITSMGLKANGSNQTLHDIPCKITLRGIR